MDQSGQERAGGQHHGIRLERHAHLRDHARDAGARAGVGDREIVDGLLEQREIGLVLEAPPDRGLVEHPVRLRARRPHRRALARIEDAELDSRLVGGDRHRAAQRVDLLDEMALADAADRGIARHLAQRFDAVGQQKRLAAHPRAGERRLGAGMAATDDDHFVSCSEYHDITTFFYILVAVGASRRNEIAIIRQSRGPENASR